VLRRGAFWQAGGVLVATACFLLLPALPGTMLGMVVLVAAIWAVQIRLGTLCGGVWGWGGLLGGTACGLGGAAVGLHFATGVPVGTALAMIVQALCFLAVPVVLFATVPRALGVRARRLVLGTLM